MEDFYIGGAALTRPAATLSFPMGEGLEVRVQDELPRRRSCAAPLIDNNAAVKQIQKL
jgi:hypothetical protein